MTDTPSIAARTLRAAAELLTPPGAWTTEYLAKDARGNAVNAHSPLAVCWCVQGAILRSARSDSHTRHLAIEALRAQLVRAGFGVGIVHFNDDFPDRTAAEVVAMLNAAAEQA